MSKLARFNHSKLSRFAVASPAFRDPKDGENKRIIFSTWSGKRLAVLEADWPNIASCNLNALPEKLSRSLFEMRLLISEGEDELGSLLDENREATKADRELYIVIQPTRLCNCACPYCGQSHTSASLCARHQQAIISRVSTKLSKGPFNSLYIAWFGGEPLAAMDVIRPLTHELRRIAAENLCHYHAKAATNGVLLTPSRAMELGELGIDFVEITLDGTREFHDLSRPLKSGAGSFDRIFNNLSAIAKDTKIKLKLSIRSNVTRANANAVLNLPAVLASAGILERIHNMYAAPIHDWGNSASSQYGMPIEEFARWEVGYLKVLASHRVPTEILPPRKAINCLVFKKGSELYDANGSVFNCSEVSYVTAYEKPITLSLRRPDDLASPIRNRFSVGHLDKPDEDISVGGRPFADFYERAQRNEFPCGECAMLPTCGGHCPKHWMEGTPACPSPKYNIGDRLIMDFLAPDQRSEGNAIINLGVHKAEKKDVVSLPAFSGALELAAKSILSPLEFHEVQIAWGVADEVLSMARQGDMNCESLLPRFSCGLSAQAIALWSVKIEPTRAYIYYKQLNFSAALLATEAANKADISLIEAGNGIFHAHRIQQAQNVIRILHKMENNSFKVDGFRSALLKHLDAQDVNFLALSGEWTRALVQALPITLVRALQGQLLSEFVRELPVIDSHLPSIVSQ